MKCWSFFSIYTYSWKNLYSFYIYSALSGYVGPYLNLFLDGPAWIRATISLCDPSGLHFALYWSHWISGILVDTKKNTLCILHCKIAHSKYALLTLNFKGLYKNCLKLHIPKYSSVIQSFIQCSFQLIMNWYSQFERLSYFFFLMEIFL